MSEQTINNKRHTNNARTLNKWCRNKQLTNKEQSNTDRTTDQVSYRPLGSRQSKKVPLAPLLDNRNYNQTSPGHTYPIYYLIP